MAVEKPGKLRGIIFYYFVATMWLHILSVVLVLTLIKDSRCVVLTFYALVYAFTSHTHRHVSHISVSLTGCIVTRNLIFIAIELM